MSKHFVEPVWHVEVAIIVAIALQLSLADQLSVLPKFLIATLELLLLVGIHLSDATIQEQRNHTRRIASLTLTAIVSITNIASLWLVSNFLIQGSKHLTGQQLIISAINIYLTNLIIFGLWYWQLDGGGPGGRGTHKPPIDFLFPQMNTPSSITEQPHWHPTFFDYMFISITNGTAFSPTDTLPLTHRAKFLMSIQAFTALLTVALVAARAINILN